MFIITSRTMDLAKRASIFMLTTARGIIKTTVSFGTRRAINQLHDSITYSFLIAGHTKFGPDRSFGIIKRSYKVTCISSLYEFAEMVESSSTAGVNKAQLVGTHDGKVIVPVYDWSAFLGQYFCQASQHKKVPSF